MRPHDADAILNIRLPTKAAEDFAAWHYEENGLYSVHSAYRLGKGLEDAEEGGQASAAHPHGSPVWKAFWKLPIPHIVLIFGWIVANDGLAMEVNKKSRKLQGQVLVLSASGRRNLRAAMRQVWELPKEEDFLQLIHSGLPGLIDRIGTDMGARVLLLLWRSWQVRNNITHDTEKLSIVGSVRFLQKYWLELCSVRQREGFDPKGKHAVVDSLVAGRNGASLGGPGSGSYQGQCGWRFRRSFWGRRRWHCGTRQRRLGSVHGVEVHCTGWGCGRAGSNGMQGRSRAGVGMVHGWYRPGVGLHIPEESLWQEEWRKIIPAFHPGRSVGSRASNLALGVCSHEKGAQ